MRPGTGEKHPGGGTFTSSDGPDRLLAWASSPEGRNPAMTVQTPPRSYETLLSPIRMGGLELPHRVVLAPMGTEMGTEDGRSTRREAAYYGARAAGGTALVMTGVNFVQSDLEPIAHGLARADTDEHTAGLRGIAEAIHAAGGLAALQLTPGLGRNNQNYDAMGWSPSLPPTTPPSSIPSAAAVP